MWRWICRGVGLALAAALALFTGPLVAQDSPQGKEAVAVAGEEVDPRMELLGLAPAAPVALWFEPAAWRSELAARLEAVEEIPLRAQSPHAMAFALLALTEGEAVASIDPLRDRFTVVARATNPQSDLERASEALGFSRTDVEVEEGDVAVMLSDVRPGRPEWVVRRNRPELYVVTSERHELLVATNHRPVAVRVATRLAEREFLGLDGEYATLAERGTEWLDVPTTDATVARVVVREGLEVLLGRVGLAPSALLIPWRGEAWINGTVETDEDALRFLGTWNGTPPPGFESLSVPGEGRFAFASSLPERTIAWTGIRTTHTQQLIEYWLAVFGAASTRGSQDFGYHALRRFEERVRRSIRFHVARSLGSEMLLVELPGTIEAGGTELAALFPVSDEAAIEENLRHIFNDSALDLRYALYTDYTVYRFVIPTVRQEVYYSTRHGALAVGGSERTVRMLLNVLPEAPLPSPFIGSASFVHSVPERTLSPVPRWMESFAEEELSEDDEGSRPFPVSLFLSVAKGDAGPEVEFRFAPGVDALIDAFFGERPPLAVADQVTPESN